MLSITKPIIPLTCTTIWTTPTPFPNVSFPSSYRSVTGINVTYHPSLFDLRILWIDDILPLIQILLNSFCLTYVSLFCHRDVIKPCPLHQFHSRIQDLCQTWFLSIHTLSSSSVCANVSCFRSLLYLSPHLLKSELSFRVSSTEPFPSPSTWLYPIFNAPSFRLFTSSAIPSSSIVRSNCNFLHPQFRSFVLTKNNLLLLSSLPLLNHYSLFLNHQSLIIVADSTDGLSFLSRITFTEHTSGYYIHQQFLLCTNCLILFNCALH